MFFKKSEPKRWHPCIVIGAMALLAVGAVTVVNGGKKLLAEAKSKMRAMWHRAECDCTGEGE